MLVEFGTVPFPAWYGAVGMTVMVDISRTTDGEDGLPPVWTGLVAGVTWPGVVVRVGATQTGAEVSVSATGQIVV